MEIKKLFICYNNCTFLTPFIIFFIYFWFDYNFIYFFIILFIFIIKIMFLCIKFHYVILVYFVWPIGFIGVGKKQNFVQNYYCIFYILFILGLYCNSKYFIWKFFDNFLTRRQFPTSIVIWAKNSTASIQLELLTPFIKNPFNFRID